MVIDDEKTVERRGIRRVFILFFSFFFNNNWSHGLLLSMIKTGQNSSINRFTCCYPCRIGSFVLPLRHDPARDDVVGIS